MNILEAKRDDEGETSSQALQHQLEETKKQSNEERFKDRTKYSENLLIWEDSFLKHLQLRCVVNPTRCVRMGMEVLLSFKREAHRVLSFDDLLNAKTVRDILEAFRSEPSTNSTSKIKYISHFEQLLSFLIIDIESPERKANPTNEELITLDIKQKTMHTQRNKDNQSSAGKKQRQRLNCYQGACQEEIDNYR